MKAKLKLFVLMAFALAVALRVEAQAPPQFTTIYQFGVSNNFPADGLTVGPGGKLFGTTEGGFYSDSGGTIFELTPNGNGAFNFETLYRFYSSGSPPGDGYAPYAGLTLSPDNTTLFGTTYNGGTNGDGIIFSLNIAQAEGSVVKSNIPKPQDGEENGLGYAIQSVFNSASGGASHATLTEIELGVALVILFGTCSAEGPNNGGSVFGLELWTDKVVGLHALAVKSNANGKLAVGGSATGSVVQKAEVKANVDTNIDLSTVTLYGVTLSGGTGTGCGTNGCGTVYSVNGDGSDFTNLYNFRATNTSDGADPQGGMVLSGNTLYGTCAAGGSGGGGTLFKINTDGSGYKIIENFGYGSTGYNPEGDLILSGDTLYGITYLGGTNGGGGTVFSINTNGSNFTVLHSFTSPVYDGNGHYTNSDGGWSDAGLVLSGYTLYGMTPYGGTNGVGTAYEIILPSPPSLGIAPSGGGVKISWPSSATNFVLQQNSNLATTNWSTNSLAISNDGTNKSATIIPAAGNAFFRLLNTNSP